MKRKVLITAAASVLLALLVGLGFLIGSSPAPTTEEAVRVRSDSSKSTFKAAYRSSFRVALKQGHTIGRTRGQKAGRIEGLRTGGSRGSAQVEAELAAIAAAQAEADRQAALAEAAERQGNCGHVLFVEGACPTDAEVQQEEDAETYCGGGRHEEAAALGIQC